MLQLITGRSGSGKTHRLFDAMEQRLLSNPAARLWLLVPEQASYENEKLLLTRFGEQLSQRVQVLSFSRMADTVFREVGGIAGRRMDSTVSLLLMNRAAAVVGDRLQVYRRQTEAGTCLPDLLTLLSECKQCGITPADLSHTADILPDGLLRSKTADLALIFDAYEALAAQASLIDPQDDLSVLADRLSDCRLFDGSYFFLDGFKGFTGQELLVLERLLPHTVQMTVTLCTEASRGSTPHTATHRFFQSERTADQLKAIAARQHVPVAAPLRLTEDHRRSDPALRSLESGCYTASPAVYKSDTDTVWVTPCADNAEECRYAARTIRRLLRENGGHCRDFTVVVRDLSTYGGLLETAMEREGLPCYIDKRESVFTQPLPTLLLSALAVVGEGWDSADVLRLCKTGLVGCSALAVAQLENYAFTWQIRGKAWLSPFEQHPDGLDARETPASLRRTQRVESLRRRVVQPLQRLSARLSGRCNGRDFAAALFRFLEDLRVPRMIRFQASRLRARGEHALADHQIRLWDVMMDLLDKFALALGETPLGLDRLTDLFGQAVAALDLGVVPQTLDSVQIGSADRIRYTNPKTVLVLGANEGVFPAYAAGSGMFTDRERRRLIGAGLPMADDADGQAAEERFYAYAAIAAPSERLIVTHAQTDGDGALLPSSLVETIRRILPGHHRGTAITADGTDTESEADAFSRLTALWADSSAQAASFREAFREDERYGSRLERLRRTAAEFSLDNTDTARRLFGTALSLYPTQVETFHNCRFYYYCQYGLRINPRQKAELNATQAGSLTHFVVETVLPAYVREQWVNCTAERVAADANRAVNRYVEEHLGGFENKDPRFRHQITQLSRLARELLWRVVQELKDSRFVPTDYELKVGTPDADGIPAWTLTTADGSSVQVKGTVDRVDVFHKDGKAYVRVVDYKTYRKSFELSEVLEGLNLQMLIYLFALCQNGGTRYGNSVPAGVLYLPALLPNIQADRDMTPEEMETKRLSTMCMSGLLLDDPEILQAMEVDLKGVFIPAKIGRNGELDRSSLATLAEFGHIQNRIATLLTGMVETLHRGDIAAIPAQSATHDGCHYCPYNDICGHEPDDPVHTIAARNTAEALADLATAAATEEVTGHE